MRSAKNMMVKWDTPCSLCGDTIHKNDVMKWDTAAYHYDCWMVTFGNK